MSSLAVNDYHLLSEPDTDEGADNANDVNPGAALEIPEHAFDDVANVDDIQIAAEDSQSESDSASPSTSVDGDDPNTEFTITDHEQNSHTIANDNIIDIVNDDDESIASSNSNDDDVNSITSNPTDDDVNFPQKEPVDLLDEVLMEATTPSTHQRDASAKDDIQPEIDASNIIDHQPDDRPSTSRYHMRSQVEPKTPMDFSSRYGFAFMQMSAREGLQRFGERAANALIEEWVQLDRLKLTKLNRQQALRLVQLIKLKRCEK